MAKTPAKPPAKKREQRSQKFGQGVTEQTFNKLHTDNLLTDPPPEATQDIELIKQTLRDIMGDKAAPAAAKAQAARTLAEMVQALGRHAAPATAPDRPIADMGAAELEAELARLTG